MLESREQTGIDFNCADDEAERRESNYFPPRRALETYESRAGRKEGDQSEIKSNHVNIHATLRGERERSAKANLLVH